MSAVANVSVGTYENTVCVRVEGRGSFETSAGLKEFFKKMLGRGYREFVVDLRPCELMDSTFMGTLAGVALRLREAGKGRLRVVNANPRNLDLLAGLGLDHLFEVSRDQPLPSALEPVPRPTGGDERARTVLEAHEALARADAANAVKFHDVIEFLKKEVSESGPGA